MAKDKFMSLPRVTVLMAVYNDERYLREAIDSILGQTFNDFEFLIINDGSTDNCVQIIKSYNDPRICLVHNDGNLGLTVSLNKGLELAQGEFVARMDADDISRTERLERQIRFMDTNPTVGVCGSWVRCFTAEGSKTWKLPKKTEEIRCWQFHTVGVAHPSVMLRRKLFAENGLFYDPHCRYAQDYELWGRAIRHMDFANIQAVLLDYRVSQDQLCATHGSEQLAAVAPLRLQRVRELGIEPTPEQQLLHGMIMTGTVPAQSIYLDRAEQWLMLLETTNRAAGTYPADLFSRRLLDIWFSMCITLADASSCSLRRCLMSPLWARVRGTSLNRARALGVWIIRKVV